MREACALSKHGAEFVLEYCQKLFSSLFYLCIGQGLLQILEYEAKGVLLLAGRNLFSAVNVKQGNLLEQFIGSAEGSAAN